MNANDSVNDKNINRQPNIRDALDALNAHARAYIALAYRDVDTARAITRIIDSLNTRYADIDARRNAGADDYQFIGDQSLLWWDIAHIHELARPTPPRRNGDQAQ